MDGMMMGARRLLEALGHSFREDDEAFLEICAERVRAEIESACNAQDVPAGLEGLASDWIAALFLEGRQRMGQLEGMENYDYAAAVQQIQEGDTTVRYFEHPSPEQRVEAFIAALKPSKEALFAHRRLKW